MISYRQINDWLENKENRQKVVLGVCFVLVFLVGFGTGRLESANQKSNPLRPVNYTTKPAAAQTAATAGAGETGQVAGAATTTAGSCIIKGNINTKGYKIYHVPGGQYYKIVKPEQCFATEADAQAAGFVKSSR